MLVTGKAGKQISMANVSTITRSELFQTAQSLSRNGNRVFIDRNHIKSLKSWQINGKFSFSSRNACIGHFKLKSYPLSELNAVPSLNNRYYVNKRLPSKMAAYIATHDRSVLTKPHGDTKSSATQNTTHKEILSKYWKFPCLCMLRVHQWCSCLTIIERGWAKYRDLSVANRSIICRSRWLRQIIDLRENEKSRYFPITEFNNSYMPTLLDNPGDSRIQSEYPDLPYG